MCCPYKSDILRHYAICIVLFLKINLKFFDNLTNKFEKLTVYVKNIYIQDDIVVHEI